MLARLLVALGAGAAIGFERSYHGRPAGFRTHALVCTASSVLSLFRMIESRMPTQGYFHFDVRFARSAAMSEEKLRSLVESHGFSIANFSYRLEGEGRVRRHSMVIRSSDRSSASRFAETLERTETVLEFRIAPTGD